MANDALSDGAWLRPLHTRHMCTLIHALVNMHYTVNRSASGKDTQPLLKYIYVLFSTIVVDVATLGAVNASGSSGCWRLMVLPEDPF